MSSMIILALCMSYAHTMIVALSWTSYAHTYHIWPLSWSLPRVGACRLLLPCGLVLHEGDWGRGGRQREGAKGLKGPTSLGPNCPFFGQDSSDAVIIIIVQHTVFETPFHEALFLFRSNIELNPALIYQSLQLYPHHGSCSLSQGAAYFEEL